MRWGSGVPVGVSGSPTADRHCCGASPRFRPLLTGVHAAEGYEGVVKVVEACAGDEVGTTNAGKIRAVTASSARVRMFAIYGDNVK